MIEGNPMNQDVRRKIVNLRGARRCGARNRSGNPCACPAIKGKLRCRLHGGRSPGAPKGIRNGAYRNGDWTEEAISERRWVRELTGPASRSKQNDG
jgi:hypothetical protein